VLVAQRSGEGRCNAESALAADVGLTAGIEMVRTPVDDRESLDDARRRAGADVALGGLLVARESAAPIWVLEISEEGRPITHKEGPELAALLRASWPLSLPPLRPRAVPPAAHNGALEAACKGDAAEAYARSGAAIGPMLYNELAPPGPLPIKDDRLGVDLGRALALERAGRHGEALPRLARVASRMLAGESWPLWRTADNAQPASAVAIGGGKSALVFENGTIEVLDLATGAPLGRAVTAKVAPPFADLGAGISLVAGPTTAQAIDGGTGAIRWSIDLVSAWPEIARMDDRVFLSGSQEVVAVTVSSGAVLWRVDRGSLAGPVVVAGKLAVADETEVVVLDPQDGRVIARADVGDEISGALVVAGNAVWVAIGADRAARLDIDKLLTAGSGKSPESARLDRLAEGMTGAVWPPAVIEGAVVLAAGDARRGPFLARIEGDGTGPAKVWTRNFVGPTFGLPDDRVLALERRRDALVALEGPNATVKWRFAPGAPIRAIEVAAGGVWIAAGTRVIALDSTSGRVDRATDLGEPVRAMAVHANGALAIGASGHAYGIPGVEDPRAVPALHDVRAAQARAATALHRTADAQTAWTAARALDPEDVEAVVALARIATQRGADQAVVPWLRVLEATRPQDLAAAEAKAALAATIGWIATIPLDGVPQSLIAVGSRVVAELGPRTVSLGPGIEHPAAAVPGVPRMEAATATVAAPALPIVTADGVRALAISTSGALVISDPARKKPTRTIDLGAAGPIALTRDRAWIARGAAVLVLDLAAMVRP